VLNAKRGKGYFYNEDSEKIGTVIAGYHKEPTDGSYIEQHKPVKHTERNRRHLKMPDEKSLCMTATMYKGAGNNGMTLVPMKPIKVGMAVEEVKVRKHEVDLEKLQQLLREAKANVKKTNKQIAEETDLPITKVEHWFRTDSSFAIPSDDIWFKLKEVLDIKEDSFDAQIMEFIYRDGVYESTQRVYSEEGKSPTITASNNEQLIEVRALTEQRTEESKRIRKEHRQRTGKDWSPRGGKEMVPREDGKMNTLTTSLTKSHILEIERLPDGVTAKSMTEVRTPEANKIRREHKKKTGKDWSPRHMRHLVERDDEKSNTITSSLTKQHIIQLTKQSDEDRTNVGASVDDLHWRKLTPLECERLQTVPDNYTNHVSNTQRYKMLGNGWTIEVIAHILKGIS